MAKRWVFGTLLGVTLVSLLPALAQAQPSTDPVPIGPSAEAPVPSGPPPCPMGPMTVDLGWPYMRYKTPPMPPMPIAHPNPIGAVKQETCYDDDCDQHVIVSGGYIPLWRHRMKKHALAVVDPVPFDDLQIAPVGSPVILDYHNVNTGWQHGYFLNVGLFCQDHVYEIEGFYVPKHPERYNVSRPGQISSFFFNPPVGFEGTGAGLWDNADGMSLSFQNELIDAEINSRYFDGACGTEVECLIGLRFINQSEKLEIFTNDDGRQLTIIPQTEATYTSKTNNRLLGPQVGAALTQQLTERLSFSCNAKLALFANYADIEILLKRGDGFIGLDGGQQKWGISALTDTGIFLHCNGSCWRLRLGYRALWIYGLATAQDQVDFDLGNERGRGDVSGSILYHGPMAAIDFIF
jgi:hypothetical protein